MVIILLAIRAERPIKCHLLRIFPIFQLIVRQIPLIQCRMIKRTQIHFLAILLIAFPSFINIVMIIVLFPTMAELTSMHIRTATFFVAFYWLVFQPVGTVSFLVLQPLVLEQFSPEILLIVRIHTGLPVVLHIERTENSLVPKNVKFLVLFHQMQQFDPELEFHMHEGTISPILTLLKTIGIIRTKSGFESFLVVHLFSLVVRVSTICVFAVFDFAFLGRVGAETALVLGRVIENALF